MAQARKFGAFAGVFTPSILTILGVIMYLRLPSIVGQAGLFQTFGIIAVAHIISVATGLSVSSIATDKKVKAGGTYYIISRSLGLPVGGTLGLALFVGLSFSVSLYLIGFSESFLGYWGLPADVGTIRITGTVALAAVTVVTLISTALALRTQFYIMTAIGLSLLSIFLGRHEFAPVSPLLRPIADAAPFIVLFGIFFPAVTGFEAGVSMSGDLKDPKRAIPAGTISAIALGLVVYMGMATFFAFTVNSEELTGNPNVLLDIAFFPPLVIAGIWGATISSAFGSILSAPRILQATATDGITPRWFSIGYGRENEPRHALVPAFLIAETGILIGQLDVIARIVSMFFITTYGFLNLTAAIESWVSPDFRPDFRVPKLVAVIGSIACFVVMIQLDFLAMLGASVILGGLYVALTRRQLRLETGDTWEGVWSSLARSALLRLDAGLTHRRNWRPNVLLFSGGLAARPHLVEFARQLAGSRGLVTNFDLRETGGAPSSELPSPDGEGAAAASGAFPSWGVFTRQVSVADVYTGIAHIADHYGFAGIEPNTAIMGYARNSRDPKRFTELLHHLADGDLNILLLDYDRDRGWGRHQRIDVWWRLAGSDVSFGLAFIRFLGNADEWRDAEVRFLTVNDHDSAFNASILRDMAKVLDEHRVQAEVRVIDNVADRRPFPEIIRGESIDADLTVLGLSDLREGDAARFVSDTNSIVGVLGTVVLAHASSFFAEPLVRAAAALRAKALAPGTEVTARGSSARPSEVDIGAPESVSLVARAVLRDLRADLESAVEEFVHRIFEIDREFVRDIGGFAARTLADLATAVENGGPSAADAVLQARDELARSGLDRIEREHTVAAAARAALLTGFADRLAAAVAARLHQAPDRLDVVPDADSEGASAIGTGGVFRRKAGHRAKARMLLEAQLWTFAVRACAALRESVSASTVKTVTVAQRWVESAISECTAIQQLRGSGNSPVERTSVKAEALQEEIEDALRQSADEEDRITREVDSRAVGAVVSFAREASAPQRRRAEREARSMEAAARTESVRIDESADALPAALELLLNGSTLALRLALVRDRIQREAALTRAQLAEAIFEPTVGRLERLGRVFHRVQGTLDPDSAAEVETVMHYHVNASAASLLSQLDERTDALAAGLPSSIAVISAATDTFLAEGRPEEVGSTELPVRDVFEYLARTEVLAPLLDEAARALDDVEASADVCREVAQLAAFELRAPEESARDAGAGIGFDVIVRSGTDRIDREIRRLRDAASSFDDAVDRRYQALVARMDAFSFARVAERLQHYVRSERGRGLVGGLTRLGLRAGRAFSEQATGLAYRRSEGVLLARRLEREGLEGRGPGLRVGRLVKSVSPRPQVIEKLPTFYRQLFLGGAAVSGDTIGFGAELAEAEAAVQAHRRGRRGALFIVAEQGHGRATLSTILTRRLFPRGSVFRLDPVEGGSIDPDTFELRLATALRMPRDDAARMIARVPAGSALVVHDLGLWWERSPGGNRVLDVITGLAERFGDRCLFIVNANIHAFRLMNRIQPMDDRILTLIECEPFHARELKDVVLMRAGAGGLGFTIDGRPDESISDWRIARFFDALFDYCNGNVGAALSAWVASIREVEDDTVHVVTPRRPRLDPFTDLDPIQRMIGVQLVIHDRVTQDRLVRITRLDRAVLAREMRVLESCGLLVQRAGGAYQIDRFTRPHFIRFLTEEGLL
jgi:amino acid transporter